MNTPIRLFTAYRSTLAEMNEATDSVDRFVASFKHDMGEHDAFALRDISKKRKLVIEKTKAFHVAREELWSYYK